MRAMSAFSSTSFDPGVVSGPALQFHRHPVLVGHHMGVRHDEAVFRHHKAWPAGHRNLPLSKHHPDGQSRWEGQRWETEITGGEREERDWETGMEERNRWREKQAEINLREGYKIMKEERRRQRDVERRQTLRWSNSLSRFPPKLCLHYDLWRHSTSVRSTVCLMPEQVGMKIRPGLAKVYPPSAPNKTKEIKKMLKNYLHTPAAYTTKMFNLSTHGVELMDTPNLRFIVFHIAHIPHFGNNNISDSSLSIWGRCQQQQRLFQPYKDWTATSSKCIHLKTDCSKPFTQRRILHLCIMYILHLLKSNHQKVWILPIHRLPLYPLSYHTNLLPTCLSNMILPLFWTQLVFSKEKPTRK